MAPNWRYLRGRIILSGHTPEDLSARDVLDVGEAVLIDAAVFGNGQLAEAMERFAASLDEAIPDRATWGTLPSQREAAQQAESLFAASRPKPPATSTI